MTSYYLLQLSCYNLIHILSSFPSYVHVPFQCECLSLLCLGWEGKEFPIPHPEVSVYFCCRFLNFAKSANNFSKHVLIFGFPKFPFFCSHSDLEMILQLNDKDLVKQENTLLNIFCLSRNRIKHIFPKNVFKFVYIWHDQEVCLKKYIG